MFLLVLWAGRSVEIMCSILGNMSHITKVVEISFFAFTSSQKSGFFETCFASAFGNVVPAVTWLPFCLVISGQNWKVRSLSSFTCSAHTVKSWGLSYGSKMNWDTHFGALLGRILQEVHFLSTLLCVNYLLHKVQDCQWRLTHKQ